MNDKNNDMLASIFRMQSELNDYVFAKNHLRDKNGETLSMRAIFSAADQGELMVNDLPNAWLSNYTRAMAEELKELDAELLWKWWSKDTIDTQNIRVELIDILHFLISAMLAAGLTAERVFEVYQQKHAVNLNRQDAGYSKATKTDDNRGIV
ncbi:MAG: xylA [Gammaproteobacteria bacterium]|nr:xylA [Gammaproteobacteria bacterium]